MTLNHNPSKKNFGKSNVKMSIYPKNSMKKLDISRPFSITVNRKYLAQRKSSKYVKTRNILARNKWGQVYKLAKSIIEIQW